MELLKKGRLSLEVNEQNIVPLDIVHSFSHTRVKHFNNQANKSHFLTTFCLVGTTIVLKTSRSNQQDEVGNFIPWTMLSEVLESKEF